MSPDTRHHRGPHPGDAEDFAPDRIPDLRAATAHLSWLLERGYPDEAALKLVGDRFRLRARPRLAVRRCACGDGAAAARAGRRLAFPDLRGRPLLVDGFNVVITVEAALGGGLVLRGRDGCLRDLASVHGSYRRVEETDRALAAIGAALEAAAAGPATWLFDQPVSNSGRLAARARALARARGWAWDTRLLPDPDPVLRASPHAVATSDSAVLDGPVAWIDLAAAALDGLSPPGPRIADLGRDPEPEG